jgi:enediyne biosynthesis protein E4
MDRLGSMIDRVRPVLAALAAAIALVATTGAARQAPGPAAPDEPRARLVALQREAATLLSRAARPETSAEARRTAWRDAAERLRALAADPPAAPSPAAAPPILDADLRTALRAAAATVSTASTGPADTRLDVAPILALLERARVRLEGEVALGLAFQGGFSQSKVKDPVYGGHASAMGPAPAPMPGAPGSGGLVTSPVTFEDAAPLPVKTYSGGPTKDHILESSGNGLALLDYDGDGRLDVYVVTGAELSPSRERVAHRNALFRNLGGWRFEDVSAKAGVDLAAWGQGVCAGDADGDGRLDLYVTTWGANVLYRSKGDGTFEDVAARSGVAAGGWSTGCAFFDADADGDLDLYVARYVRTTWNEVVAAKRTLTWRNGPSIMVGPQGLPGEPDLFFENLGGGRFRDATAAAGLTDAAGAYGFGVVTTDYDGDGRVDLFVANDSNPNFLYRNVTPPGGAPRFESVGLVAGVAVNGEARAQAGMGADAGDYDGDGRVDLALTAFAHDRNTIYRNVDGGAFEDASAAAGIAASTFARMGWGTAFLDADLDGRLDLAVANGHIFADVDRFPALGETYAQASQLLLNQGGTFRDVSAGTGKGLQTPRVSRGLAVGDLDDDGDPDVVLSNMDAAPALLENRQRTGRHWIAFRLSAPAGNRFAVGATVRVTSGGRTQMREVRSGGSYLSQSDLRPLFGLGDATGPVAVEVRMPGGARWSWQDLPVDRLHVLELTGTGSR